MSEYLCNKCRFKCSSRSFRIKCDKDFYSEHISSCGVPQCSVLGSLLSMYTTPQHSHLITFLNHHPYADNTQFFHLILVILTQISSVSQLFCNRFPPGCPQVFLLLVDYLIDWLFIHGLNCSKTEFLIIGLTVSSIARPSVSSSSVAHIT